MTTVLFVHGTGVRAVKFAATLEQVKAGVRTVRDDLAVESCYWGGNGARLWARGASFYFDPTGADAARPPSDDPDGPEDIDFDDMDMEGFGAGGDPPVPEAELALCAGCSCAPTRSSRSGCGRSGERRGRYRTRSP